MSDLLPPPESEVKPQSVTEALAMPTGGKQLTLWGDVWRKLKRDKRFYVAAFLIGIFVLMAIAPFLFLTKDPNVCPITDSALPMSKQHWFGTDILGCDYYSRVIYGARTSMEVGLIVSTLSIVIALSLGAAAGYFGGWVDTVISRWADIWFSIPTLLGALLVLTLFNGGGPVLVSLVIVMFAWPDMTRLVRSTVISGKSRGYVRAARTMGARGKRILRRHVLPNGIAPVLVFAAYVVGSSVGAEAGLTFLGVGLRLPTISWGLQLAVADTRFPEDAYLMFWPSLFLCLLIGAFILLGESLRDAMDPKLFGGDV
jgi:ABC-type dipeptide/oligopeptide/nickel transport system permease subunit